MITRHCSVGWGRPGRALGQLVSVALAISVLGCSGSDGAEGDAGSGALGSGSPVMENAGLGPSGAPAAAGQTEANTPGSGNPGSNEGPPAVIMNGTADPTDPAASPSGSGLRLGDTCLPVCADASTDADATGATDGYGFELGRSCVVLGSAPALTGVPCEPPPPMSEEVPGLIPGPGFFIGDTCLAPCGSDVTDPDATGATDGFGFEQGQTCIVPGSAPSTQGLPCLPGASTTEGDGYLVGELCVPACTVPRLADTQGYGFEGLQTCVVEGLPAAIQAARCAILPRQGLPTPGEGVQLTDGCFPPCVDVAGAVDGFGFEQERACVVVGSDAAVAGVPCVPPPAEVTGFCPPSPLACPVANGITLTCGCGFRQGFAERKQVIMSTPGASQYFLASAMMETDSLTANYPLGDVFPNGVNKTGDAFNGGIAKQNWGMMRRCHPAWAGLGGGNFLTGAELNDNLALDIQVYNECRQTFGNDWWSFHRRGFGNNTNLEDVQMFRAAMDWTNLMLEGHLADDVFFFVVVPAI